MRALLKGFKRRVLQGTPRATGATLAARLIGDRVKTVLDVGARWGTSGAWYRLSPLAKVVGFEPDAEECARLNRTASPYERFVPIALGASRETVTIHVTREPGCSSIYPPDMSVARRYAGLDIMTPVRTVTLDTIRLQDWAREEDCTDDIAFMKLDVQGYELSILQGAGPTLDRCLGLEVEVEFNPLYEGQPLFADVDQFLRARGFALWRLDQLVHYSERPLRQLPRSASAMYSGIDSPFNAGAGRLYWANAIYFRDYRALPANLIDVTSELTLAALYDAAGDTDAHLASLQHLLSRFSDVLTSDQRRSLLDHIDVVNLGE